MNVHSCIRHMLRSADDKPFVLKLGKKTRTIPMRSEEELEQHSREEERNRKEADDRFDERKRNGDKHDRYGNFEEED